MAVDDTTSSDVAEDAMLDTTVESDNTTNETEDAELDDIEVNESDIEDNDDEEEASDSEDTESEESADDESEADAESQDDAEAELSDEDKQKALNNEMAQRRIQEREARIARVREAQQEYVAEAANNEDPLDAAVRQLQVDAYNNTVERTANTVTNQYQRAITDFPVLNTQDPVIQKEIDDAIDAFEARYVTIDSFGNPTDVRGDLYATLQAKADSIEKLTGIRAKRQEQSKSKEKSKTLTTPTRAPQKPKSDPDLDAFDEEAGL